MFVLGHLGIGSWLAARRVRADSIAWLLFGAVLPDLIDKPLYYALSFATLREHAGVSLESPWMLGSELLGATLLVWQWRTGVFSPLQERLRKRGAPARSG